MPTRDCRRVRRQRHVRRIPIRQLMLRAHRAAYRTVPVLDEQVKLKVRMVSTKMDQHDLALTNPSWA